MRDDQLFDKAIATYSPKAQNLLRKLRELAHQTADAIPNVGEITEALRWNQFSFLTERSGSTFRIDGRRSDPDTVAVYFHCQSGLIDEFKNHYAGQLVFEGKRAIILNVNADFSEAVLRHCFLLALTHHLRKFPASRRNTKIA